eukprot:TRINITY_DN2980_c0_g1_i1.p1 TRINITY_DN2980_c0_g1~~TRINITY_DN2980_c0_g1_i1.p1  ORF type:complete len:529 (-),score=121.33 TRINITY_DN2980_c0_g1_i1:19-1605(-)
MLRRGRQEKVLKLIEQHSKWIQLVLMVSSVALFCAHLWNPEEVSVDENSLGRGFSPVSYGMKVFKENIQNMNVGMSKNGKSDEGKWVELSSQLEGVKWRMVPSMKTSEGRAVIIWVSFADQNDKSKEFWNDFIQSKTAHKVVGRGKTSIHNHLSIDLHVIALPNDETLDPNVIVNDVNFRRTIGSSLWRASLFVQVGSSYPNSNHRHVGVWVPKYSQLDLLAITESHALRDGFVARAVNDEWMTMQPQNRIIKKMATHLRSEMNVDTEAIFLPFGDDVSRGFLWDVVWSLSHLDEQLHHSYTQYALIHTQSNERVSMEEESSMRFYSGTYYIPACLAMGAVFLRLMTMQKPLDQNSDVLLKYQGWITLGFLMFAGASVSLVLSSLPSFAASSAGLVLVGVMMHFITCHQMKSIRVVDRESFRESHEIVVWVVCLVMSIVLANIAFHAIVPLIVINTILAHAVIDKSIGRQTFVIWMLLPIISSFIQSFTDVSGVFQCTWVGISLVLMGVLWQQHAMILHACQEEMRMS